MDQNKVLTAEELKAEQDELARLSQTEDKVRDELVAEFELDPVEDAERLDKLVKREMAQRGKTQEAIKAKILHRTEAENLRKTPPKEVVKEPKPEEVEKAVTAVLEKRDYDALDYPDDIKAEIQKIAAAQGISIKKAAQDPYIKFKLDQAEKTRKAEEAAAGRNNRRTGKTEYDGKNIPNFDMSTPEGRKAYDAFLKEHPEAFTGGAQ